MNVLVLGGSGFLGTAVCMRLLEQAHAVRMFCRCGAEFEHPLSGHVDWVCGNFSEEMDLSGVLIGMDAVVHLISTTVPKSSADNPLFDVQSNLCSTLRLLAQLKSSRVSKLVFISSGGTIYGRSQYLPIDERHPTEPMVSYGIVKLAIEKYLRLYREVTDASVTVLRVANVYGERQTVKSGQGAVGAFLHQALNGLPIEIWGDGSIVRDYIYVGDVARAIVQALENQSAHSVFNIGSGCGLSLNQVVDEIEGALVTKLTKIYRPTRSIDVPVNVLDCTLAANELGWQPMVGFPEGIRRTIEWLRSNTKV